jgi:hypothetical protein
VAGVWKDGLQLNFCMQTSRKALEDSAMSIFRNKEMARKTLNNLIYVVVFLLLAARISAATDIVPFHSSWKYRDDGSDQGTAWQSPSFDDSTWASGSAELGYGDGDEATVVSYGSNPNRKYTTTYFRKMFTSAIRLLFPTSR